MRIPLILLLSYGAVLAGFTLFVHKISDHSTSRLATIESLVERGTFAIDGAAYQTIDKVSIDGRFYSHQPPLLAVLGTLAYYPLHLAGLRLAPEERATYNLVTFAMNGLPALIGLVFFVRALHRTGIPPQLHLPLAASLACATLWLPFSVVFNSHGFCAALMAAGLYYVVLSRDTPMPRGALFGAGLAFSACASADHAMLAFYVLFGAALWSRTELRGSMLWFLLPSLLTLVPTFAYYYVIGHSFKPFAARPELFAYAGSYWSPSGPAETRLTGATWNSLPFAAGYGASMLVGARRGFLVYNPLAVVALYGIARSIAKRGRYWREAAAAMMASGAVLGYYALSSSNYSGATYSIRWFVPFLPLWWFFGAGAVEGIAHWEPWKKRLLAGLCVLSVFYAFAGALNPWPLEWRGFLLPLSNFSEAWKQYHGGI